MISAADKQSGFIVIFLALSLIVLLGFFGLSIDSARHMLIHAELQNAADACALAAAPELNSAPDSLERAALAGSFVGGEKNLKNFQFAPTEINIDNVTFSATLSGTYLDKNAADYSSIKFVKCVATAPGITNFFQSLFGINSTDLSAFAIASLKPSQAACTLPMAIFSNNDDSPSNNYGYVVDRSVIEVKQDPVSGSSGYPGFFVWADVTGVNGTSNSALESSMISHGECQQVKPAGSCVNLRTGNIADLNDAWNSRFGLYRTLTPSQAPPDLTGFGWNPAAGLTSAGTLASYNNKAASREIYQNNASGYSKPPGVHSSHGSSNRRLVTLAVLSKSNAGCSSGQGKLIGYACMLMLSPVTSQVGWRKQLVMYEGDSTSPDSPCSTFGTPGNDDDIGPLVPSLIQ